MSKKLVLILIALLISQFSAYAEKSKDSLKSFTLPSVNVTSSKANETLTATPFAEISKSELKKMNSMQDLPKLMSSMPSILSYSENGNFMGYTNLTLRGFDQRRIAVNVNGIPQNDPEDHNFYWINMSDIGSSLDNIQVQRGAGLNMYGAPSIAGSINLSTSNFINERGIKISSGIGFGQNDYKHSINQSSSRNSISFSSGLVDKYAFYTKLTKINSFGYRDQSYAYMNSYFISGARFDENLTTQINIYGGSQDDGLAYTGLPKSYIKNDSLRRLNYNYFSYDSTGKNLSWTTTRRNKEVENFSQPVIELLNDWKISDNLKLQISSFYKIGEGYFDYDGTGWTSASSFRLDSINGYPGAEDPRNPIIRAFVQNRTGGIIPRLTYNHQDGELTVGTELRLHKSEHWGKINYAENLPESYDPDYKFYSYQGHRIISSVYAREQYTGLENFTLNFDAQLVYHNYAIDNEKSGNEFTRYNTLNGIITNGDEIFSINYLFFNPRLGINFQLDENSNAYFSAALTSREPRMRNLYAAEEAFSGAFPLFDANSLNESTKVYDFTKPLVKPERMFNIELGYNLRNEDYNINLNFYLLQYQNELVKNGQRDIFGVAIDGNAPKTTHYGAEFQFGINLIKSEFGNLVLSGNATYSVNKIIEFDLIFANNKTLSLKDNKISGFPDFMGNVKLAYELDNFNCSLSLKSVGEYYTDNYGELIKTNADLQEFLSYSYYYDNIQEAYTISNLNINYKFENILGLNSLLLQFEIYNLTNEKYSSGANGMEFFPAAERQFFLGFELGI